FFRLNVYSLRLPPLRERDEDLARLAGHFVRRFSRELGKDIHDISGDTLALLRRYSWPGNVRELQSVLKQAILQATGHVLLPEFLPDSVRGVAGNASVTARPKSEFPDLERFLQSRLEAGTTDLHAEYEAATERVLFLRVLQ